MSRMHLHEELENSVTAGPVVVETKYGTVKGGRAANGAAVFLEVPYALPPVRFSNPQPLPPDYRYDADDSLYIKESRYCVQPRNDGQGSVVPYVDRVGFGKPSENPLFVNIVSPPSFTPNAKLPVKVYIHGGFLQFGSPHGLGSQAQYVSAERNEVWVNIGYRLSVFGFLACDEPKIEGNFGFKDQWLALLWVQDNIAAFGGDPENIQISGLSAGAHSVHQILHHVSHLPSGQNAPFRSAFLQSNAIFTTPKTSAELREQFVALCETLKLDPTAPDILEILRDPFKVSAESLMHVIETDSVGIENGTYRGCLDGEWIPVSPDPMEWQRSGNLARSLREKGVKSIILGDLTEEWYLYAIAHPVEGPKDVFPNILRYYPLPIVEKLVTFYRTLPDDADAEESQRLMGEILADGQIHIPVRMFARDFQNAGFPILRYEIQWTPEQVRPKGWVTHATDRPFWALRIPSMTPDQVEVAVAWLDAVDKELKIVESAGEQTRPVSAMLTLKKDKTIGWTEDGKLDHLLSIAQILPGEQ